MFRNVGLLAVILLTVLLASCGLFSGYNPKLEWSTSPTETILQATNCCGFVPELVPLNYIPDAQLFGDGRLVWVINDIEGGRHVMTTQLGSQQIKDLLKRFVDAGFFQWKDEYADNTITDIPWQCLQVKLLGKEKQVCEYYRGAPAAFHTLYNDVASGLGLTGSDYVPARGYLSAKLLEGINPSEITMTGEWPANTGISLQSSATGIWVQGAALEAAWNFVNASYWGNIIRENGRYYQLVLQIPGITMMEPPAQ